MKIFISAILLIWLFPSGAYAYIDPGSGSIILQVLLVVIVGVIYNVKMVHQKIKMFFYRFWARKKKTDDE